MSKAVDAYHSLCTASKWHVSNESSGYFDVVCWNCEKEGCSVNTCPQPKYQKKIAANKMKFLEQKQKSGGTNGGSKTSSRNDSHNYNQNKWGAPKNGIGIKLIGNKPMR